MTYELEFHPDALDELARARSARARPVQEKLEERLLNPRIPSARLLGQKDRFNIKLRQIGYRLVYEVRDPTLVVLVVAVGKRERNAGSQWQSPGQPLRPRELAYIGARTAALDSSSTLMKGVRDASLCRSASPLPMPVEP